MAHLSPEELIDLAEGARPESSAPHLLSCAACGRQLADLRGLMATVSEVEVPEPSPFFWDRLSARIHEAVATEARPARRWGLDRVPWVLAAAMSAAIVVIALSVTMRSRPESAGTSLIVGTPSGTSVGGDSFSTTDDDSLSLLRDLALDLDWDAAAEAGMTMAVGTADNALTEMTDPERLELQRLLREALSDGRTM